MKKLFALCLLLAWTAASYGIPISDFTLQDINGKTHQLSQYADKKGVVLLIQGNGCPIVRHAMSTFRLIRDKYEKKGFAFLLINPQTQDTPNSINKEATQFNFADFTILNDTSQLVSESLDVDRTGEVFLVDAKNMQLLFRGPVDDRLHYETQKLEADKTYLTDALDTTLAGKELDKKVILSPGCDIFFISKEDHANRTISYHKEIAPIINQRCGSCHTGSKGADKLDSYAALKGAADQVKSMVLARHIAPGKLDPNQDFNANKKDQLSDEEMQLLAHWIDSGTPE